MGQVKTVGALWAHYKKHHLPQTRSAWRAEIAWRHLAVVFDKKDPASIEALDFMTYFGSRGPVSDSTLSRELGTLSAVLAHGRKHGLTQANPYIPKRPQAPARSRVLSAAEQVRLLEAAKDNDSLLLFIQLALLTGQRREAIVTLKWEQVNWAHKVIDFRDRTATNQSRMKGRGVVPIGAELLYILSVAHGAEPSALMVIPDWDGDVKYLVSSFPMACKKAGIEGVTPHTLRHTVATNLVRKGVPLLEVSRLLGHKSVTTTEKNYLSLTPDFIANAAMKLTLD